MWAFWSVVYLWLLFELTIPLLELLPEENLALIVLITASLVCFYKVSAMRKHYKIKLILKFVYVGQTACNFKPRRTEHQRRRQFA